MPLYQIEANNGQKYQIEGPEGATEAQVIAAIEAELADQDPKRDALVDELFKQEEISTEKVQKDDPFYEDILKGFGAGFVDTVESAALGGAAIAGEETETGLRDSIQGVAKGLRPDVDPDSTWGKIAGGLGSAAAFIAPAIAAAATLPATAATVVGTGIAGVLGLSAAAGEASERARAADATEKQRTSATFSPAVALAGAIEILPLGRFVKAIHVPFISDLVNKVGPDVAAAASNRVTRAFASGGVEAGQEVVSEVLQNLNEKYGYNPDKSVFIDAGLVESGEIGFTTGFILDALSGRRISKSDKKLGTVDNEGQFVPTLEEGEEQGELFAGRTQSPYVEATKEFDAEGNAIPITDSDKQFVAEEYEKQETQKYTELAKEDFAKQGNQNPTAIELSDKARELQVADLTRTEAKQDSAQPDLFNLEGDPTRQTAEDTAQREARDREGERALERGDEATFEQPSLIALEEEQRQRRLGKPIFPADQFMDNTVDPFGERAPATVEETQTELEDLIAETPRRPSSREIAESETETVAGQLDTQQRKTTEARRTAVLQDVIESTPTKQTDTLISNFSKALAAAGIGNTTPTAAELNTISRAIDIQRAEKPALEEVEAKQYQIGRDGKRLLRTEIPSLEKEITPKTPEIERLSATASADVLEEEQINAEPTLLPENLASTEVATERGGVGVESGVEVPENVPAAPDTVSTEGAGTTTRAALGGLGGDTVGTTVGESGVDSTLASAARTESPTPDKKSTRSTTRKKAPGDVVDKVGKLLGIKKIKRKIATKTADPKAVSKVYEEGKIQIEKQRVAKNKKASVETLKKEGVSKPTAEQIEKKTKERKEKIQSKKDAKKQIDDAVKDIKLTEKRKITETKLATFVQEDTTQKDINKSNVINPTPARIAADNIQFYMNEFPNQDPTTQLSMGELTTVLDLVNNPPSDSDISAPARDKTGRAAAYIYFSKQGNPRDVLDVVAHDVFFAPAVEKPTDYESKASREYFYNANEQNAGLARKWIDANLNQSQVEISEGETTYKLNFSNVDYEKNTPNIEKLRKLGLTEKEIKKQIPINPVTGKAIPKFDTKIQPKKEKVILPNVTFIPANKTLYNLILKQANDYLNINTNENLVDLGVSRRGDSFAQKTLDTLKIQREATSQLVIYNTNEVVSNIIPEKLSGNTKGIVLIKDGKEVFGPFPENKNHPLEGKNLEDYKYLETSAINGLDIPLHPVIRSLLTQGKLHEALVAMGNSSANKRVAQIARALSKVSGSTKVKIIRNLTMDNSGTEVSGKFDPKTNTIFLDADTGINAHVILHEMTHAATSEVVANMSSQEAKKLKNLYEGVKDQLDTAYGSQNLDEFIAEAFSNPEFQQKLAGIQYKNTGGGFINALKRFYNTIENYVRKLLRMQPKDMNTALNESDQLIRDMLSPAPENRNAGELLMINGKDRIDKLGDFIASKYKETMSKETTEQFQDRLTNLLESKIGIKLQQWTLRALPLKAVADQIGQLNKKAITRLKEDLKNATTATQRTAINEKLTILRKNTGMKLNDAILNLEGDLAKADAEVEGTLKKLEPWIIKAKKEDKLTAWNEVIHDSTIERVDPTDPASVYENDPVKSAVHTKLRNKLKGLGPDAVKNYELLRDSYAAQFEKLKAVIEARMSEITDEATFSRFKKDVFDKMFDKASIKPYFPLMRKGDFWVRFEVPVIQPDGTKTNELVVEAYESYKAREVRIAELTKGKEAENITKYTNPKTKDFKGVPPTSFVGEVLDVLNKAKVDQETQDNILNLFIEVLPESSFAKGFKKREGVLGAQMDAYDVLRTKGFDIGRQTARMLNSAKIAKIQKELAEETIQFKIDDEGDARNRVQDELQTRGNFARNPPPDHVASMANRLAFIGTIGFNVSSAVVNLSQIPLMFYPILGGRYGYKEANSALGLSTRLFVGSGLSRKLRTLTGENVDAKGSISIDNYFESSGETLILRKDLETELNKTEDGKDKIKNLNKIIPLIMQAQRHGQLGRSLFYDTLNIETAGKERTAWDKLNAWSAWTFHHMERMNRQVALVASYNLELDRLNTKPNSKEQGLSPVEKQELAAQNAIYLTTEMNGGATLSTTSGIAQQGVGRVAMMYKGYGMQMYYTMYTRARDAIKNSSDPDLSVEENKELRKAAIKQVSGIFASSFLLAGVQGMPLVGAFLAITNIFKDDDDEDAETQLRTLIGEGFYKGPLNYVSGVDVASRIGLSNLLFRGNPYSDPDASLTTQFAQLLTGPAGSMGDQVYRGIQELQEGEIERAALNFVPAAVRNMYKATIKYSPIGDDAILTRRGDVIYDDLNSWELGAQFFGFAPAEYTKRQEMNRITKNQDRDIVSQSTKLLKRYYIATRMGGDTYDALQDILKYNQKFPSMAISPSSIIRSMKMHMKTSLLMHNGITISPRMRAYLEAQRSEWSPASAYED
jgi:hypothetical protein